MAMVLMSSLRCIPKQQLNNNDIMIISLIGSSTLALLDK